MYFRYGTSEVEYLKAKDRALGEIIDKIGHIDRETDTDLFSSVVHHIIGQQISTKAQAAIWTRMKEQLGEVNAESMTAADVDILQSFGMTFRKAEYISVVSLYLWAVAGGAIPELKDHISKKGRI
ncbi:MAG: DNA repair protein [Eubacterium sp.]|nr:DNA repair protein [Eubacterium sp.]